MPLRDWGLGLEEITEYYHRYGLYYTDFGLNKPSQHWFMTRGIVDQTFKYSITSDVSLRLPMEIDLIGFRISHDCKIQEVRLIQCTETVTTSKAQDIAKSMLMPKLSGIMDSAQRKKILSKYVSYVKITPDAKEILQENTIRLLSFDTMMQQLIKMLITLKKIKRKGYAREQPLWLLRTLVDKGYFDKERLKRLESELDFD